MEKLMAKPVIMLAAGGTGGHIFPALSVGEYLLDHGWTPVFVTDKRGRHMIPDDVKTITISAASPFAARFHLRLWRLFRLGLGLLSSAVYCVSSPQGRDRFWWLSRCATRDRGLWAWLAGNAS